MTLASRPPLTAAQLVAAQSRLGLSNLELAHALEITGKGAADQVSKYRAGIRPLPMRASQLIRVWLHKDCPADVRPWPKGAGR